MIETLFSIYDTDKQQSIGKEYFVKFLYNYPGRDIFKLIEEIGDKRTHYKPRSSQDANKEDIDMLKRNSEFKIDFDRSMMNEEGIMCLSNLATVRQDHGKNNTILSSKHFFKQPTSMDNKIRYIADIIFRRYGKKNQLTLKSFSLWLKLHKEFLDSFKDWFRADIWRTYTDKVSNRELSGFHSMLPDIEGEVKLQKFNSFIKKKAYLKLYDRFLMLFKDKNDILPQRVIILQLIDISFNEPKMKIVITHESKRYEDIKILVPERDIFNHWKNHVDDFTNNIINRKYKWSESEIIGRGKFSTVYRIRDRNSKKHFALKFIEKGELTPEEQTAILNEANIMSVLDHSNIIKLYQTVETQRNYFYVFELVDGCDLYKYVTDKNYLEEHEASFIMNNLLDAIECVHSRGIIHRDLKPENIMLGFKEDELSKLKLIDFGLACFQLDEAAMKTKCGTINYTAPEILIGKDFTPMVDLFALGVILYFMIRGSLPFYSDDQHVIARKTVEGEYDLEADEFFFNVSDGCKELIKGLLEVDPNKRLTLIEARSHNWISKPEALKKFESKNKDQFDINDYL